MTHCMIYKKDEVLKQWFGDKEGLESRKWDLVAYEGYRPSLFEIKTVSEAFGDVKAQAREV